jgi:hypothetical protein
MLHSLFGIEEQYLEYAIILAVPLYWYFISCFVDYIFKKILNRLNKSLKVYKKTDK